MGDFHFLSTTRTGQQSSFWTPLHLAVSYGQRHVVDLLLERGAWIDAASMNYCKYEIWSLSPKGKYTPLHVAIYCSEDDVAKALISKGDSIYVDCEVRRPERTWGLDRGRLTAMHCCAIYGRLSAAQYLIRQGHDAAIDEIDEYGFSPLMYAYYYGKFDVFEFLLAQGANPRITTTTPRPNIETDAFRPEFVSTFNRIL